MRRYPGLAHTLIYSIKAYLFKRHMITVEVTATDNTRHTEKTHLISVQLIRGKQRGLTIAGRVSWSLGRPKKRMHVSRVQSLALPRGAFCRA